MPVKQARPGVLVLDRNPNLPPGPGDNQALRYAAGPWAGTAYFSLRPRTKTGWTEASVGLRGHLCPGDREAAHRAAPTAVAGEAMGWTLVRKILLVGIGPAFGVSLHAPIEA